MVYFLLGVDWVWWVKRWLDFKLEFKLLGVTIFLGEAEAIQYYNEPNAWHLRTDWDNYLGGRGLLVVVGFRSHQRLACRTRVGFLRLVCWT